MVGIKRYVHVRTRCSGSRPASTGDWGSWESPCGNSSALMPPPEEKRRAEIHSGADKKVGF